MRNFLVGVVVLAAIIFNSSCDDIKNNQVPVTSDVFISAADSLGYLVTRLQPDEEEYGIGIREIVIADKKIDNQPFHVHFYVVKNDEIARQFFMFYEEHFKKEIPVLSKYGHPNGSGLFGNTQDITIISNGPMRRLIQVENTFAFSVTQDAVQDKDTKALFDAIGYRFLLDKE